MKEPGSEDLTADAQYLTASEAAWLCAIPCAIVVFLAILVVGPPFGRLLHLDPTQYRFLRNYRPLVAPEPTEEGRFLVALTAPILLSLVTIAVVRRQPRLGERLKRVGVTGTQLVMVGLLAACVIGQYQMRYGPRYTLANLWERWIFFTPTTLAVAAAIAAVAVVAMRDARSSALVSTWLRESAARRAVASVLAVASTAIWLLHAIQTDHSIANMPWTVRYHLAFPLDEAFAVLNGRTPLVDFTTQYGSLWPWVAALSMLVLGKTVLVFTITMCSISAAAFLALFDVLRRVTRSAFTALLLYLPILATSLFKVRGDWLDRDTFGTYFGVFPLRYAGPYLLACLTARDLDERGAESRTWLLFATAGLVAINNLDFGIPALGASIAALIWTRPRPARLLHMARSVVVGLATACVLVSMLTLARAGSLPQTSRLLDYSWLYANSGFDFNRIGNVFGLHVAIYLTYVAAIGTATVRAVTRASNRVLTGMLVWSGVFGLGAGGYFVGRSHPEALIASFSAWALALALLTIVVVRHVDVKRPSLATFSVLFGLGIAICSLAQTPAPWSQIERFGRPFTAGLNSTEDLPLLPVHDTDTRNFVSSLATGPSEYAVKRGAPVAILITTGHRVADTYGIVNVSPYTGWNSTETEERVEAVLNALERAGGNTVIVPREVDWNMLKLLARRGFEVVTNTGRLARMDPERGVDHPLLIRWRESLLTKWVDTRHVPPRALR